MKSLFSTLLFLMFFVNLSAQNVDPANQERIESFVRSHVYAQPETIDKDVTDKVFSGTFYNAKVKISYLPTESQSFTDTGFNVHNDSVTKLKSCCSNQEFPTLLSLVKRDFLLKDENAAKQFEAALDVLYPVDEEDLQYVKHLQEGSQWIFIRGTFFDNLQAFVVTTDTDGTVTKISHNLEYAKK